MLLPTAFIVLIAFGFASGREPRKCGTLSDNALLKMKNLARKGNTNRPKLLEATSSPLMIYPGTHIAPVCLPRATYGVSPNPNLYSKDVFLLGYSANKDLSPDGPGNTNLKVIHGGVPSPTRFKGVILTTGHKGQTRGICGGDSGGPMIEIYKKQAVLIALNKNSDWDCQNESIFLHKNKTDRVQYSLALKMRLDDVDRESILVDENHPVKVFPQQ